MSFDVFISYSSKDKQVADAACARLEAMGIRCWIAPRDILPGSEYGSAILEALHQSRAVVLIFSSRANESTQVRREIERAVAKGIPIVPLRIENIAPTHSLEYFIGTVHWLDALTQPLDQHLLRLGHAIQALLSVERAPPDGSASPSPNESQVRFTDVAGAPAAPSIRSGWLTRQTGFGIAGVAAALLAIGVGLYWRSITKAESAVCEKLWIERNSYYKSHGYCFQTQKAKDHFGNTGCVYNDQNYIYDNVFSNEERAKVLDIRNEEKANSCG